jgi:hypothetical protein
MMNTANHPTAGQSELQVEQRFPSGLGGRRIKSPEENTGQDLKKKGKHYQCRKKLSAALCFRNVPMPEFMNQSGYGGTVIKPNQKIVEHFIVLWTGFMCVKEANAVTVFSPKMQCLSTVPAFFPHSLSKKTANGLFLDCGYLKARRKRIQSMFQFVCPHFVGFAAEQERKINV